MTRSLSTPAARTFPYRALLLGLLLGFCFGLLLAATPRAARASDDLTTLSRALAVLEDPRNAPRGSLRLFGRLFVDGEAIASTSSMNGTVEATLDLTSLASGAPSGEVVTVSVVLAQIDGDPVVFHDPVAIDSPGATQWVYRREIELPEDFLEAAIVVRAADGSWGATGCSFSSGAPGPQATTSVHQAPSLAAPAPDATPTPEERARARQQASVVRILPPRSRPATGRTKIETLVGSAAVEKVVFFLNGRRSGSDDRAPFAAVLDLGELAREHDLRVEAYGDGDLLLGEDRLLVNESNRPFEVLLRRVEITSGVLELAADVGTPTGVALDRVEFLVNDDLVATLDSPPFTARHPLAEMKPTDFASVRAWSADGEMREDARLLTDTGTSERVDVNLVEMYTVVTDSSGRPIKDLTVDDFTLTLGGDEIEIERFAFADEVPLVLGLIIDTSKSMWAIMDETKKAGSRFLANTLLEGDRAFLVDFDTQPRLAHETTGEVTDLLRTFSTLKPDGFTAMFDALLFSLLQFEEIGDRRALVLLTDGDDYQSQYGRRRVIESCRELGVPAYFLGLAGVVNPLLANQRKLDLEGVAKATGGRVHYISDMAELDEAYDQINAELRSQYVLTFTTDRALTDAELEKLKLKVRGRGYDARFAVGRR